MIDQPRASKLAKEAFGLWEAGRLHEAALRYAETLKFADPAHWNLPSYHSEFACVLAELGQNDEATLQYERALSVELAHGELESSPAVLIARYFLAYHLIRNDNPTRALDVLAPSIREAPNNWYSRFAEAEALYLLDRLAEAKAAAECAVTNAPSEEKREELKESLKHILGVTGAAN